jgi:type I restriction enzyme, R subunit
MSGGFAESDAEEAALGWLETLGYTVKHGPEIAFGVDGGERRDPGYRDTILQNRLHRALNRLNPGLPTAAVFDAYRRLLRVEAPNLFARNRTLHRMLVDGVNVEYTRADGSIAGAQAKVIDFERPEQNDWLAVNQFTVVEGQQSRRADIVIFVNGLPLGVIELKNPADEGVTVWDAVQQLENYQSLIPALFTYNALLIASDGVQARIGALGASKEWFKPWRTISGREDAAPGLPELQVVSPVCFSRAGFSISFAISLCSRISAAALSQRRSRDIINSTQSMSRSKRRCGPPISRPKPRRRPEPISRAIALAASRETSASASCGTPRVQARA